MPSIRPEPEGPFDLTNYLRRARTGDLRAFDELFPRILSELRRLARVAQARAPSTSLDVTEVIDQEYLRLFHGDGQDWKDRYHFYALAGRAKRSVLLDHALRKRREKSPT